MRPWRCCWVRQQKKSRVQEGIERLATGASLWFATSDYASTGEEMTDGKQVDTRPDQTAMGSQPGDISHKEGGRRKCLDRTDGWQSARKTR